MKKLLQVISFVLVVTLILQIAPVTVSRVLASEAVDDSAPMMQTAEEAEIVCEEVEKREENVKHFRLSDGSYLAAQYDVPVHYEDENGVWQEYDNRLSLIENRSTEENQEYAVRSNNLELKLAKKAKAQNMFRVKNGAYELTWGYQGSNKSRIEVVETADDGDHLSLHNLYGESFYRNLYTNVDLQVFTTPEGIKENLILKEASAQSSFVLNYHHAELTPVQIDSRTIVLRDAGGADVFWVTAPVVSDAEGKSSADAVTLTLGSTEDGKSVITLSVSDDWLADAVYPVAIDPTVNLSAGLSSRLTSYYVKKNGNSTMSYELLVSDQYRGFMQLDPITLGSTQRITNATLELFVMGGKAEAEIIDIHAVTSAWSGPFTWAEQPTHDATVLEQKAITSADTHTRVAFNVTKAVQNWMAYEADSTNGYANHGLMFRNHDEASTSGATISIGVVPFGTFGVSARPSLTVSYIDSTGIKSHFSYQSNAVGINGSGNIQDVTGNLVLQENVFSCTGNRLAASLTLTYNRNQKDVLDIEGGGVGYGWRLSSQQAYVFGTIPYYADGTGAKYYFVEDGETLRDEEGLNLTVSTEMPYMILSDLGGNQMGFNTLINGTKAPLHYVVDANGNRLDYGYGFVNGNARLHSIVDSAGRALQFHYQSDSDLLVRSVSYASGGTVKQIASFAYDENSRLQSITYADGGVVTYTEGTDVAGRETLTISSNLSNNRIVYTFDGSGRVISVSEGNGSTEQVVLQIDYNGVDKTVYTDRLGNQGEVHFDEKGRMVSAVAADGSVTNYRYDSSDDLAKVNRIVGSSYVPKHSDNLLVNSSFANTASGWSMDQATMSMVSFPPDRLDECPGTGRMSLTKNNGYGTGYVWQTIDISEREAEDYTASVYLMTTGLTSNVIGGGAHLKLEYYDANGNLLSASTSEAVIGTTQLQRIYLTAPVPDGASTLRLYVGMLSAQGLAQFDCVQLEEGDAVNQYNALENGDFSVSNGWSRSNLSSDDGYTSSGTYLISGSFGTNKSIFQDVSVYEFGKSVSFAVIAKADALPEGTDRLFAIRVRFYYEDGTTEEELQHFNSFEEGLQTAAIMATPDKKDVSVTKVRVYIDYHGQANELEIHQATLYLDGVGAEYEYNNQGLLTSQVTTDGNYTDYSYDQDEDGTDDGVNPFTVTNALGHEQKMDYDENQNLTRNFDTEIDVGTMYSYDEYGNAIKTDAGHADDNGYVNIQQYGSITNRYTFTSDGNYLAQTIDSRGAVVMYDYDSITGQLLSTKDPKNVTTTYTYDNTTDLLTAVTTAGVSVQYGYNAKQQLTEVTHNGFRYKMLYNVWEQIAGIQVENRTLATYTYDDETHNLSRLDYGNGGYAAYTYNKLGQTVRVTGDSGMDVQSDYDNNGRLFRVRDIKNQLVNEYQYDFNGNVTKTKVSGARVQETEYVYDDYDRLVERTNKIGSDSFTSALTYRPDGVVTASSSGLNYTKYTYDGFDRITNKVYGSAVEGEPLAVEYEYAPGDVNYSNQTSNLISWERHLLFGSVSNTLTRFYTHDLNGNITSVRYGANAGSVVLKETYYYDDLGRLVRENNANAEKTWVYTYDNGGNILSKTEYAYTTASDLSALTPVDVITYTYGDSEWKDLLTAYDGQAITYDGIGNPLQYRGMIMSWQNGRNLTEIVKDGSLINYTYDALGNRIEKTVNNVSTLYYYDDSGNLLMQTDGTNTIKFYTGLQSGKPTGFDYNGQKYWYVYNKLGDVIALYSESSNSICVEYTYDAWGNVTTINGASTIGLINPIRYRGYYYDAETGFYHLGSRYYDPTTHRFINADGYVSTGQGVNSTNMFAYCNNNPVNGVDPSGEYSVDPEQYRRMEEQYGKAAADGWAQDAMTVMNTAEGQYALDMGYSSAGGLKYKAEYLPDGGEIRGPFVIAQSATTDLGTENLIFVSPEQVKQLVKGRADERLGLADFGNEIINSLVNDLLPVDLSIIEFVMELEQIWYREQAWKKIEKAASIGAGIVAFRVLVSTIGGPTMIPVVGIWEGEFGCYPYARVPYKQR